MKMRDTIRMLKLIVKDPRGVTAVEYAVIAGVIVVAIATAFTTLANKLTGFFNTLSL
jgi:pilus assembly protein Flp/PilA